MINKQTPQITPYVHYAGYIPKRTYPNALLSSHTPSHLNFCSKNG